MDAAEKIPWERIGSGEPVDAAVKIPCESDNVNIPVHLGLAYDHQLHSCNWPDLLQHMGCDPEALLGGFQCPTLGGRKGLVDLQKDDINKMQ